MTKEKLKGLATEVTSVEIYEYPPEVAKLFKKNPLNRLGYSGEDNRVAKKRERRIENHIRRLCEAMREDGFDRHRPIVLDSKGMVQTGHSRLEAALKENVNVFVTYRDGIDFLKNTGDDDNQLKWSTENYIRAKGSEGNKHYQEVARVLDTYPNFPFKVIIAAVCDIANEANADKFKFMRSGKFAFKPSRTRVDAELLLDEIQELVDIIPKAFKPKKNHVPMHLALSYLWIVKNVNYSEKRFWKMVHQNRSKLIPQTGGKKNNMQMLVDIYNYGLNKQSRNRIEVK